MPPPKPSTATGSRSNQCIAQEQEWGWVCVGVCVCFLFSLLPQFWRVAGGWCLSASPSWHVQAAGKSSFPLSADSLAPLALRQHGQSRDRPPPWLGAQFFGAAFGRPPPAWPCRGAVSPSVPGFPAAASLVLWGERWGCRDALAGCAVVVSVAGQHARSFVSSWYGQEIDLEGAIDKKKRGG